MASQQPRLARWHNSDSWTELYVPVGRAGPLSRYLTQKVPLTDPQGWVAYLSEQAVERLVVFVHGFHGQSRNRMGTIKRGAEWWPGRRSEDDDD